MIVYLTAYRGTGKDTLVKAIPSKQQLNALGWKVFGPSKIHRISFADTLKVDVCNELRLFDVIPSSIDPYFPNHKLTSVEWVQGGYFETIKDRYSVRGKSLRKSSNG